MIDPRPARLSVARIIYGFPTTGKSTLQRKYTQRYGLDAIRFVDTDELVALVKPDWFAKKQWRDATTEQRRELDAEVGTVARQILDKDPRVVVFTNLWGHSFRSALDSVLDLWEGRLPIGVIRTSPEEVYALSKARGGTPIPVELASEWLDGWEKGPGDAIFHLIPLEPHQPPKFMAEVLTLDYPWLKERRPT